MSRSGILGKRNPIAKLVGLIGGISLPFSLVIILARTVSFVHVRKVWVVPRIG